MILAGDIGGTKTVVALFERRDDRLELRRDATFRSRDHASLEEILVSFLDGDPTAIDAACFGVAGAVVGGQAQTTNLPWTLDEAELAGAVGARRVKLLNDLEAAAYGMLELGSDERARLNAGTDVGARGNAVVIAAGTGLGEAVLFWDGARYHAVASEGGHASFAARTDEEIALLQFLQTEFGQHVSMERVLSGPGLYNIYRFVRETGSTPEPDWLAAQIEHGDPSVAVGRAGVEGRDPACAHALELFAAIYGAEAGNLALRGVAVGGVFIGGGVAPKILPALQSGRFMEAFTDKGRFARMLEGVEVSVALDPRTPLRGAARTAAQL